MATGPCSLHKVVGSLVAQHVGHMCLRYSLLLDDHPQFVLELP